MPPAQIGRQAADAARNGEETKERYPQRFADNQTGADAKTIRAGQILHPISTHQNAGIGKGKNRQNDERNRLVQEMFELV